MPAIAVQQDGGAMTKPSVDILKKVATSALPYVFTVITGDASINPHVGAYYLLTKGSAAAITLPAPTSGVDDGVSIVFSQASVQQHVITATGLMLTGTATVNVATAPAAGAGASIEFVAYAGKWIVKTNMAWVLT